MPDLFLFARPERKQQYLHVFGQRAERNTFEKMTGSIAKFNVILGAKPEELADLDKAAPQIESYLRWTAAPFGILTNGRCWGLYRQQSGGGRDYYEIDLINLLNAIQAGEQDDEAFSFFYHLFPKDAFPPAENLSDASDGAPYFLYQALGSSQLVTNYVSEQLPKEGF